MKKRTPGRLPDYAFRYLTPGSKAIDPIENYNPSRTSRRIEARKDPAPKKMSWLARFINWIKSLFA